MTDWQARVKEFHDKFGVPGNTTPGLRDVALAMDLIHEEFQETDGAAYTGDLVKAADGLVDQLYVILGAANRWGIDLEPLFNAVHKANMAKEGGAVRRDGKILKPEGWQAPDIAGELRKQGWGG